MPQKLFCTINGKLMEQALAPYSSADDFFRLRYGVYETYLNCRGNLEFKELHWERLMKGLSVLAFQIPAHFTLPFFSQQIEELVTKNGLVHLARVRLQVFSDSKTEPFIPQFLIECFAIEEASCTWLEEGIQIGLLSDFHKKKSSSNNCKINHNGHFLLAREQIQKNNFDDMLLQNEHGNIIESAIANLFWVKDKTIYTAPLSDGCVAGTMRQVLIELIKNSAFPFEERSIAYPDLMKADEIFLTNGIRKIRWVRKCDDHLFGREISMKIYDFLTIKA